jgi:hypothetical protein
MRTTLTLDDDVAVRVEREQRKRRVPFRTVVNDLLRAGLDASQARRPPRKPFETRAVRLGPSLIGSLDNIEEVLARAEGEDHR